MVTRTIHLALFILVCSSNYMPVQLLTESFSAGVQTTINSPPDETVASKANSTEKIIKLCNSSIIKGDNTSQEFTTVVDCERPLSGQNSTEIPTNGGTQEGGQKSSSSRRSNRYANGKISKVHYTSIMKVLDPIRFTLHVLSTPLLIITVVSFARETTITCSNSFILAVNLFEAFAAFFNSVFYVMKYSMEPTAKVYIVWVLICNYGIVCSRRVVYTFNVIVCLQRLVAVMAPLRYRQTFTSSWRNAVFGLVICSVFGAHVYLTLMYDVKDYGNGMYVMARSSYYVNHESVFDYIGYFSKSLFSYIPLVLSLVVNFVLIGVLKRHNTRAKEMRTTKDQESVSKQERQTTLMILVSTIAFTFLSLPYNINLMVATFLDHYGTGQSENYLYSVIKSCANILQTLGDLTNFASYMMLSSSFRRQVLRTIGCQFSKKKKHVYSTAVQNSSQDKTLSQCVTSTDVDANAN